MIRTIKLLLLLLTTLIVAVPAWVWYTATRDTSIYAPRFTEEAFTRIRIGMSIASVYDILGAPLETMHRTRSEMWFYDPGYMTNVEFGRDGHVSKVRGAGLNCRVGMLRADVLRSLGRPSYRVARSTSALYYSKLAPGAGGVYHARIVTLDDANRVVEVVRYRCPD
jgi:outer membrane protein assembly factor BamE (lipoprotein component of BamABCDE complex)